MTFLGKIKSGFKRTLGKASNVGRTILKKVDSVVDKAENIGKKVLATPIVGDMVKAGWEQLKASNPKIAALSASAKGIRNGIEKANDLVDNFELKTNKYIDDPKKLLSKEVKKDFNQMRDQVRNIAPLPEPSMPAM